jgi:hypothetical protein
MNPRIKELLAQTETDISGKWISIESAERFAELIVRECAEVADQERPNYLGCGYVTKTKGGLIREYFGVER